MNRRQKIKRWIYRWESDEIEMDELIDVIISEVDSDDS